MAHETVSALHKSEALGVAAAARLSGWLRGYKPFVGIPDELLDRTGRPRHSWLSFLGEIAEYPDDEFQNRFSLATRHIRDTGVSYRVYGEENERSWPLNPLPLILDEAEWAQIAEGVEQRARLMEAVLQDIYGDGTLLSCGALPAAAITGSADFIRPIQGVRPPGGRYLQLYAADLGRGPDGRWWVLDDRSQAPSGAGYALENRLVLSRAFPSLYNAMNVQRLAGFFDGLRKGLAAAADRSDPRICLLTPGPFSETYFEQAHLARYLGFLLVEGDDLLVRDGRAYVRTIAGLKRADVIWRRVDADFIDPLELNSASRLGTPGLLEAIRQGGVAVLNMPGSGVLQSKALEGFLPRLSRRLLGEELKMPNIATWWCGQPAEQAMVESNLEHLAIAPAFGGPGPDGVTGQARLMADLTPEQREAFLKRFRDRPGDFVGQEVVKLSTTPVLRDGRLEPAPFVLRVFVAATPDGLKIMPGGFCRTSEQADVRAISMGDEARTADVWVIGDKPVERITLLASRDEVKIHRILGHLPSRAADNLFWLGRYLERAEATLRLVRSLCTSLMDSEAALHTSGETLSRLQQLLINWGALGEDALGRPALEVARDTLHDRAAYGSVINLVRNARRTAASMRERLSPDFWTLLMNLETRLLEHAQEVWSEAAALEQVETALQALAALSGLAQENMNRVAGWRFMDMGRRIERGINTCRYVRTLADDAATIDDLDLLLDLADSQISYRARYLVGLALTPVRDMIVLDPFNTRSLAFQIFKLKEHLATLPTLQEDGMLEEPSKILLPLATEVQTADAACLDMESVLAYEQSLLSLSMAVADRFFLQGAHAAPTPRANALA
ncbi:circularly permuted type 2 ATP-grasp protein [Phenylobacterium sp.]|uniref:circularly permuted type 2 ATP-grasp protein n=1 Tax=Phenylobacterium sp. TaxID=1871053 RepID=UPI0035AE682C